jgi:hypothetical protein
LSPSRFSTYEKQRYARPDGRRRGRKAVVCEGRKGEKGITMREVLDYHFGVATSRRKRSRMSAWSSLCASRSQATMARNWSLVKSSIRRYSSKGTNRCLLRYRSSMRERLAGLAFSFLPTYQAQSVSCPTCGAPIGKSCVLHSGATRPAAHVDRRHSAAAAVERERF